MQTQDHNDLSYESLAEALVQCVPELQQAQRELHEWWDGEKPGPHVVFGDLLNPYIDAVVLANNSESLARVFALLERMAKSGDDRIRDVVISTVCEHIASNPKTLIGTRDFMGEATRALCAAIGGQ